MTYTILDCCNVHVTGMGVAILSYQPAAGLTAGCNTISCYFFLQWSQSYCYSTV